MNNLEDKIEIINGFNVLIITVPPNNSVIIEPSNMIHMNGKLVVEPIVQSKTNSFLSQAYNGIKKSVTGNSLFSNQLSNHTNERLKLSIGSLLVGGILKIEIQPDEIWRFTPSSFLACTTNLLVSGNLNIFKNFKAALGGQTILYSEISSKDGNPGTVWISSYGGIQKHEIKMGVNTEKLFINDGCFLGMLSSKNKIDYWDKFVNVGSANGFLKGLLTKTALLLKIEDKKPLSENNDKKCIVYTQTLNLRNLDTRIALIAQQSVSSSGGISFDISGGDNKDKYNKYEAKYNNLITKE